MTQTARRASDAATILVIGGAGYIGSHTVKELLRLGHRVVVYDNLSTGHREFVLSKDFVEADLADGEALRRTLERFGVDTVIHFAAHTAVGESVERPGKYYRNNVAGTLELLEAMRACGVGRIVFSSSAAVYGAPQRLPLTEDHPKAPVNPYGRTKWIVEQILADYGIAHGLQHVSLRYFNAAGSDPAGEIGERHEPECHLIPIVLEAAAGRRPHIEIYGTDYPTEDGTGVRDYIHVQDLARAHIAALDALRSSRAALAYNLGIGRGYTVRQVIDACRAVTGREIPVIEGPRRAGDPAVLVADASRARAELDWTPRFTELEPIVETAWAWMQRSDPAPAP